MPLNISGRWSKFSQTRLGEIFSRVNSVLGTHVSVATLQRQTARSSGVGSINLWDCISSNNRLFWDATLMPCCIRYARILSVTFLLTSHKASWVNQPSAPGVLSFRSCVSKCRNAMRICFGNDVCGRSCSLLISPPKLFATLAWSARWIISPKIPAWS